MAAWTVVVWVVTLVILLTSRRWAVNNLRLVPMMAIVGVYVLVILYCIISVRLTTHRQRRMIAAQLEAVEHQKETYQRKRQYLEYKRALTATSLVLANVIFYLPLFVTLTIELAAKAEKRTNNFTYIVEPCIRTFGFLQSLVNPIIMSLRMSSIRQGVKKKLMFIKRRTSQVSHHRNNFKIKDNRNHASSSL